MGASSSTNSNRRRNQPPHSYYSDPVPPPAPAPAPNGYLPPPPPPQPYYAAAAHPYNHLISRYSYPQQNQPYFYGGYPNNGGWRGPVGGPPPPPPPAIEPAPYVEHQDAKKVRNDVNVHKDTLKVVVDPENPDHSLVSFVFDAMVDGRITIFYFAKEESNCKFVPLFPEAYLSTKIPFQKGIGQKFCQPSGTGIDLGFFELDDLSKPSPKEDVFPLVVVAATHLSDLGPEQQDSNSMSDMSNNMQITQAVLEKKSGDQFQVKVIRQILWIEGVRYELREIYGMGSSSDAGFDDSNPGKECVICLTEPKDTAILPCRHMCLCNECAKALRLQSNKCPICRQPIEKLIEIKVSNEGQ